MSNSCFIHSSTDGNLGCFQILDIINNVSMNIGMLMFFQISVLGFFRYIPRSGITGSKGRSIFIYLFIYLSVIYLSIYLSSIIYLSIYLFIFIVYSIMVVPSFSPFGFPWSRHSGALGGIRGMPLVYGHEGANSIPWSYVHFVHASTGCLSMFH